MRHRRTILSHVAVAVALLLAGCGGGGGGGAATQDTTQDTTAESSSSPGSGSATTGGTTKKQKAMVERPSGAPLGEVFPPGDDAYLLLSQGRCRELLDRTATWRKGENPVNEDAFFLYRAAAEACLNRWDDAKADDAKLEALAPSFSGGCDSSNCERCMRAVKEWLDGALAAHRQAGDAEVQYVKGTKASPCPEGVGTPDETTTTDGRTTSSGRRPTTSRSASTTAP